MPASKAKIAANTRYNVKAYETLSIRVRKDANLNDRIDQAIQSGKAKSKADFVIQAVLDRLERGDQPAPSPDDAIASMLSASSVSAMDAAISCGYADDRIQYIRRAVDLQLERDKATEIDRRRRIRQAKIDASLRMSMPTDACTE